ncbi:MAG: hypothetical protein JWL64_575, partial [Frankiales bacterium]|nr:hypothetical protein [Frankiales bacterium]
MSRAPRSKTARLRRALPATAVAAVLCLSVAACGGDDEGTTAADTSTAASDTGLGTPNAAKGDPIKLGF